MRGVGAAAWLVANWVMPNTPNLAAVEKGQLYQPQPQQQFTATSFLSSTNLWLADAAAAAAPPSKAEVQLLRQAFAEFYGLTRDLPKAEQLLTQAITAWERQAPDERAGLYRVRGDCYAAMNNANKAIEDYNVAVSLLQGPGGDLADPAELPASLLGRARSFKSLGGTSPQQAKQAAADYQQYLQLVSREDWDTAQERLEDGATRNPYAAWEWGSALRLAGEWKEAAQAHALAAQAFTEIGDKARSVISLIDAGVDLAAANSNKEAKELLSTAIDKTKGVESRDVQLLQRVIAKEGEGRMALAALLWAEQVERGKAETVLGDACVRLEQLQADAVAKAKSKMVLVPENTGLKFSIDDSTPALEVSCFRFKNPVFLDSLGWPKDLQEKVIRLETLR